MKSRVLKKIFSNSTHAESKLYWNKVYASGGEIMSIIALINYVRLIKLSRFEEENAKSTLQMYGVQMYPSQFA